jgi:hypothetical protein
MPAARAGLGDEGDVVPKRLTIETSHTNTEQRLPVKRESLQGEDALEEVDCGELRECNMLKSPLAGGIKCRSPLGIPKARDVCVCARACVSNPIAPLQGAHVCILRWLGNPVLPPSLKGMVILGAGRTLVLALAAMTCLSCPIITYR